MQGSCLIVFFVMFHVVPTLLYVNFLLNGQHGAQKKVKVFILFKSKLSNVVSKFLKLEENLVSQLAL